MNQKKDKPVVNILKGRRIPIKDEQINEEKNEVLSACQLTNDNRNLLKNFCDAVAELKHNYCPICKECFPSVTLNNKNGSCRCSRDKLMPKRFSQKNDMDSGGQLGYRGHVIYVPQDVQKFITRDPATIDTFGYMLQTLPKSRSVFERLHAVYDDSSSTKDTTNLSNSDDNLNNSSNMNDVNMPDSHHE
ncbi:hypothetical protein C2G38_2210417 [Gigaspora rosea]|uniref:Uncharacterized protein n=1 Tax=Gigaspora rosea TaxID=44941 RepID=A0A397UIG7_9GLOM|nr:hypothetical protein C2G38_2210417 [Gigaspora rosea]